MSFLSFRGALSTQSDLSQPIVILAVAVAMAGLAILILFAKDKI